MKSIFACTMLSLVVMGAITAHADTLEVGAGKPHATIAAAVNAAASGDTILVYSGTYTDDLAFGKSLTISEAPGETALFKPTSTGWSIFMTDAGTLVWNRIDIQWDGNGLGILLGNHGKVVDVTFNDMSMSNTANSTTMGFGPLTVYQTGTVTLNNVDITMTAIAGNGILNVTPSDNDATRNNPGHFVLNDCAISGVADTNRYLVGGQAVYGDYVFNRSSFTHASGEGTASYFFNGAGGAQGNITRYELNDCQMVATSRSVGLGLDVENLVARRSVFKFNAGAGLNAPRHAGWVQSFENCVWHLGGASTGNAVVYQPTDGNAGTLNLTHCTIVATTPGASVRVLTNLQTAGVVTLNLRNNILKLTGTDAGVADGPADKINITAGANLRDYATVATDKLTGTITDAPAMLAADNIHYAEGSPAAGKGVDVGVTDDIDKQARPNPAGSNPDLGADETWEVPVELSNFSID